MAITKIQSESLNLADTYDFTGTVTGAGEANTPYFYAYQGSVTSLADNAFTKVTMDNEVQDSAGAFSSSRFTVPSGEAGRYFFHFSVGVNTSSNIGALFPILYVNGSENSNGARIRKYHPGSSAAIGTYSQSGFFNASVGDYFEVFCYQNSGGAINSYNSSQDTFFMGFKVSS
jgi:hypothetical protein